MIVQIEQLMEFARKSLWILEILHPQRATRNFVFVSGSDAATSGANLGIATLFAGCLASHIQHRVKRQDQGASLADTQARAQLDADFFQTRNFFKQLGCGQHHTIANVTLDARAHDATWNQMQCRFHTVDNQCVARIVAALKANHALCTLSQPVDQFAFALIAPLGAYDDDVTSFGCDHMFSLISIVLTAARPIAARPESARDRNGTHQFHSHGPATRTRPFRPACAATRLPREAGHPHARAHG